MPNIPLITLRSNNADKLCEFYTRILGLDFELHADHGQAHYAADDGKTVLEIYASKTPVMPTDMISFGDMNLDDIVAKLTPEQIVRQQTSSPYGRFMIIKDPDSRKLYLEAQK